MKKKLLIPILLMFFWLTLTGCTNNKEIDLLKQENLQLKEKLWVEGEITWTEEKMANLVKATVSRIWWSLSRETSIIWDEIYYNTDIGEETIPLQSKNYLWQFFNSAWDSLVINCNEWYIMTKCEPFSNIDNVTSDDNSCRLLNEDPNLMRTSMIVECDKI